ncbi:MULTISPECIES: MFS transporter [Aerococcus]|nr:MULTISPECIES: glycoside-pentoside-hexuronide (GPH):cation symporter [Aerococcus]MDK6369616.1 glycoside-pentoside-hexuronide (GPH):cation symporter [Aerococcus sp. UMB9870]MDK6680121.1 glycoside-pentoside-hexuronide (GPH):cation symporter [Aerococcus sp. UMB8608]MDK6686282.1 glycoside-pentoside-hexuronide (GPH):cation symporter [Aerococcus sp. UMB8623]MDK6940202.1 glycoside-pentoside-hexuronide (GPH):cation symporter [Aerococcus sp. UMB8487]
MAERTATKPFGMSDKLGYMFGDFGNDFTFILSSMFLMKFYTDVMGVSSGIVGGIMAGARIVDAFTDMTMGQIVDRTKPTPVGKFLPWIRRMAGPVALASFLMYASWFQDMPMWFKIGWMIFTYILWGSVFYTSINIPFGSMASAISADPKHRAELSTWRTIGATLAQTFIGVVLPLVVYYNDSSGAQVLSGTRMTIAAGVCSILAVVCYALCYKMTTERVKIEQKTERFDFKDMVKQLASNKALIGIVVSSICLLLTQLTLSAMLPYVFPNYFGNTQAQAAATFVGSAATLILSTFVVQLSSKLGRKELGICAAIFTAVVLILAYFLQISNAWVFVAFYGLAYSGIGCFMLITWAMITDVIDHTEVQTNERSDGMIYSVYSFARKMGQAASSGLAGWLLTLVGYSTATAFDPAVTQGIYNITCLAPAVGAILLAVSLFFLYPLNKKQVEENAAILAERR